MLLNILFTKVVYAYEFIALCCSGASGLIVATSKWKKLWRKQGRAKRLMRNGSKDRVRKCSYNPVKSTSRTMSMRGAAASEAKNTRSSLEKWPYPCVQCGSKLYSHPQTLSITVHFAILLTFHTSWPSIPKAHATPTYLSNAHLLVQRSLRCAWGLHCKYVNLVLRHFMLLLAFCHQIQHCIISTGGPWR